MDSFPMRMLLSPYRTFAALAAGRDGWGWPLALYALSALSSAALSLNLPQEYLGESLAGFGPDRGRGLAFYAAAGAAGGAALTLFLAALALALGRFLEGGRLAARLIAAGALTAAFGFAAAATHGAGVAGRAAALALALLAAALAVREALRDRAAFCGAAKGFLAVSVLALAGDLAGGLAALAGSPRAYAGLELAFAFLALYWSARCVSVVAGSSVQRAVAAVGLAALGAFAFLFLCHNSGLLPAAVMEALLLG